MHAQIVGVLPTPRGPQILPAIRLTLTATLLAVISLLTLSARVRAQSGEGVDGEIPPSSDRPYDHATMAPVIYAAPLVGQIRIDGIPDEEAWGAAQPFTEFTQREPDEGLPCSERTEVRVLVGPDALYVGGRFYDTEPDQIRATLVRRDVVSDFDYVMVHLDSRHDHNTAYAFTLTPSGAYQDAALGADGQYDFGWDPVWEGAAHIDDEGWSAEWKIPFSQLRFESSEAPEWGIQISRNIARKQESAWFAFTPLNERAGPHRYGHLRGMGSVKEPSGLELLPYVTTRSEHLNVEGRDPFRGPSEQFYNIGLDLKYGVTSQLTLDATINPDFGQVEVDPAVVNLTQYETYFPERRPFFVEGSEIFRYGFSGFEMGGSDMGDLFYSRRIGRAPQRDLQELGAEYVESPAQTTIAGAMKMSGRLGESWSLGLLEAATLEEKGRFVTSDGVRGTGVVEPFSNYMVGRVRRDFREGSSTIGGIVTAVNRSLTDDALASVLHSGAYVAGMDFRHMWKNREWFVTGTLTGSRVQGSADAILLTQRSPARYWQRPDATHVGVDPTRTSINGWRGSISAGRGAGDHWRGAISSSAQSPGFEANDLGFETRVDSWDVNLALQYRDTEPDERTRSYQIDFSPYLEWNFDGDLVGADLFLGSIQQWSNFWMSSTAISAHPETDNDRLTRGGPVARNPAGFTVSQWISTDRRKPYNLSLNASYARNGRGGWGFFPSVAVTVRPSSAVEISMEPSYRRTAAVAQYVTAVTDENADGTYGARYVFSDLDQTTLSMGTRVSWTFTPRVSLQLFVQPFMSSGEYSRYKELHQPREWDWDVYGEERGTFSESGGTVEIDPDGAGSSEAFAFSNPDFTVRSLRGNAVLRWEYLPGSTLYLVWQQSRFSNVNDGRFQLEKDYEALFRTPPENVFALKVSYWLGG
jgi:hypothetical protein